MKNLCTTLILTFCTQFLNAQTRFDLQSLAKISWLEGHWLRTNDKPGHKTIEFWEILPSKEMSGYGITTNPDTIFHEGIILKMVDQELVFKVTDKKSLQTVDFKIIELNENGFVSVNSENDFPKRIQYQKTEKGFLATISIPGTEVKFDFVRPKD